jgi:predicted ester cyclase
LHRAFPDIDVIVADMFAEHDKVVTRVIARGTHLGPLPHILPTAQRTAVMGHEIWRVANGRILEHWGRFEDLDLLQQLGAFATPSVPA